MDADGTNESEQKAKVQHLQQDRIAVSSCTQPLLTYTHHKPKPTIHVRVPTGKW